MKETLLTAAYKLPQLLPPPPAQFEHSFTCKQKNISDYKPLQTYYKRPLQMYWNELIYYNVLELK